MGVAYNFHKRTIRDVPLDGATVLVRADYNVPLKKDGTISDDLRIRASLPTVQYLLDRRCKVVIISHLGRPDGRDLSQSLAPVATRLGEQLDIPVTFVEDCTGDVTYQAVKQAAPGSIVLLENLRYYTEEEANDEAFAKKLADAAQARYFVQDGFGVVHRAHASTDAITHFMPSVAGLLLEKEVSTISGAMQSPERPLVAVLGGAKVSDKIKVIERFVSVADTIVIGGAMANTFLAYKGFSMGKSLVEPDQREVLDAIYAAAAEKVGEDSVDEFILLPTDFAVATGTDDPTVPRRVVSREAVSEDMMALDIGDESIETAVRVLNEAKTVIWNGPLGYSEIEAFAHGSARVALALATHPSITSVIGGGDTADFVLKWDGNGGASFSHVSTGGGAGLDLMAGKQLPGVESLLDATK